MSGWTDIALSGAPAAAPLAANSCGSLQRQDVSRYVPLTLTLQPAKLVDRTRRVDIGAVGFRPTVQLLASCETVATQCRSALGIYANESTLGIAFNRCCAPISIEVTECQIE